MNRRSRWKLQESHAEPAKPEEPAPPEETAVQNADEVPQEDKEHRCGRPTGGVSTDAAKAVLPKRPPNQRRLPLI